jgi:hypothetical protein
MALDVSGSSDGDTGTYIDDYILRKSRSYQDSGHTMRHISGLPAAHSARKAFDHGRMEYPKDHEGDPHVRDYNHVPITKTWGCKLYENKKGRSWLQRQRRYERHVERQERQVALNEEIEEVAEVGSDTENP